MPELASLDAADPLRGFVDEFVVDDPDLIYLDGNSLGRLHPAVADAVERATRTEWGDGLVRSWSHWIDGPRRVGDLIGSLIGAGPGQTLIADQTSLNLYKLAWAAVEVQTPRNVIVTDAGNFPSDHYVLDAVARHHGGTLRAVDTITDLTEAIGNDTALVSLSHVDFKT
ncbi:MAG: kynureninase, partial [Acidimicrobiia bacterium]|nr:kynureninase [Acidimicrobiia bacterium]